MILAGRYSRPIEQMAKAAGKVAAGDFDQSLPVARRDEIGQLARSFDHMIVQLREDRDLRQRLRTAEHMATVGQFARSIAHEIKNPLNFISLSADHMRDAYRPADTEAAVVITSYSIHYTKLYDDFQSTVFCSTASMALLMAEEIHHRGIADKIAVKKIIYGSERSSVSMRRKISELFGGAELFDITGLTELYGPGTGIECSDHDCIV